MPRSPWLASPGCMKNAGAPLRPRSPARRARARGSARHRRRRGLAAGRSLTAKYKSNPLRAAPPAMHDALSVALILLASAVAVVALFRRLLLPPILGYLLVGALVGPHALAFVPATEAQRYLAEFGVVFLMFSVGLEFSLPQLVAMRSIVFGLGSGQFLATLAIGAFAAMAAGADWRAGIVVGGVAAMSSTAIVSKTLADRGELHSGYGRRVMGVLLFQDLAVIPLLVLIPALTLSTGAIAQAIGAALVKAAIVLAIVLYVGQRLMRPL